ncbi:MAG: V-type ATPase subunit [Candidatus Izemoplasmataceae bacterium]
MGSLTGNAIISKAKSIYGNRLKEEDYEYLLKVRTVPEIVTYLKNKVNYREFLQDVRDEEIHRGQLEELIKKAHFGHTMKLVKFVETKDSKFFELNMVQREIDVVLSVLRFLISEDQDKAYSDYPTFFTKHASFDVFDLTKSESFPEVLKKLEGTRYHPVLKPFNVNRNEDIDYAKIEHQMDKLYYDEVFKRIDNLYKGNEKEELEEIFKTKIELENIIKVYRLKKFYNADKETIMESLILKHSKMSRRRLEELIALPEADLIFYYLERSGFSQTVERGDEYVYVEYYAEKIKFNLAKQYIYFSKNAPKVYSAFLILLEIERSNLFHIIEGIRYDLGEDEIRNMLIY